MRVTVDSRLVLRVRRTIGRAAPHAATVDEGAWRRERDRWLDLFDAGVDAELPASDIRSLIDFLSEAAPAPEARMSDREWSDAVGALVPELLAILPE